MRLGKRLDGVESAFRGTYFDGPLEDLVEDDRVVDHRPDDKDVVGAHSGQKLVVGAESDPFDTLLEPLEYI